MSVDEIGCHFHLASTHEDIRAVQQMKTVVRDLPTGNVTMTYWDQLRHTYHQPGNIHADVPSPACTEMFTLQSVLHMHIQTDMSCSRICVC